MLSIASHLLGSGISIGLDVDEEALESAWINCRKLEIFDIDLVLTDVLTSKFNHSQFEQKFQ
jgi:predicted RNA methylase